MGVAVAASLPQAIATMLISPPTSSANAARRDEFELIRIRPSVTMWNPACYPKGLRSMPFGHVETGAIPANFPMPTGCRTGASSRVREPETLTSARTSLAVRWIGTLARVFRRCQSATPLLRRLRDEIRRHHDAGETRSANRCPIATTNGRTEPRHEGCRPARQPPLSHRKRFDGRQARPVT